MNSLQQFESRLKPGCPVEKLWEEAKPYINAGNVESRDQAYVLFSQVLKITNLSKLDETLKGLWFNLLQQGSFTLQLKDSQPIHYNFHTITKLMETGRDSFKLDVLEVDPTSADLAKLAEAVHIIGESSLGGSPGVSRFQSILASPVTLCLLAHERETFIACLYGSYLELSRVNIFHINFLGRRIEYPSVHVLEILQDEVHRIQLRFPNVEYLTLNVRVSNAHMIPTYKALGFEELEYVESGGQGKPIYYYGKKIDPNSAKEPPTYAEFKAALDATRS